MCLVFRVSGGRFFLSQDGHNNTNRAYLLLVPSNVLMCNYCHIAVTVTYVMTEDYLISTPTNART